MAHAVGRPRKRRQAGSVLWRRMSRFVSGAVCKGLAVVWVWVALRALVAGAEAGVPDDIDPLLMVPLLVLAAGCLILLFSGSGAEPARLQSQRPPRRQSRIVADRRPKLLQDVIFVDFARRSGRIVIRDNARPVRRRALTGPPARRPQRLARRGRYTPADTLSRHP